MKTWHYVTIGGALIIGYLLVTKKTTILKAKTSTPNNLGGTLTGAGSALTGLSNLYDSIFNKDSETEAGDV